MKAHERPKMVCDGAFVPPDVFDRSGELAVQGRCPGNTFGDRGRIRVRLDDRFAKLGVGSRELRRSLGKLLPEVN